MPKSLQQSDDVEDTRLWHDESSSRNQMQAAASTPAAAQHQHRRNQKDSNDLLLMTNAESQEFIDFDCSDYNIGRNQPQFEGSNKDVLQGEEHGEEDSNDLDMYDLAVLCLADITVDVENGGPALYLCDDISQAKGQVIPYEYRVYLSKIDDEEDTTTTLDADNIEGGVNGGDVTFSKADVADETTITDAALRDLEANIMTYVSDKMGLADCDMNNPIPTRRRSLTTKSHIRRRLGEEMDRNGGDKIASLTPLIGLSSDPQDTIEDCPENSPNLPFTCKYVKGHLAAYFGSETDDATMTNYANVIVNQISVGMENDIFVGDKAKLLMYIPPTPVLLSVEEEGGQDQDLKAQVPVRTVNEGLVSPAGEAKQPSSSYLGYILIGVGCIVGSALLLLFVHMRRRRKHRRSSVVEHENDNSHFEQTINESEDHETIGNESYCVEVEISDTETLAMSVDKDGHMEKIQDKPMKSIKIDSQGTAATEDDCATIATQESGVTLYLDMKRVDSDVSALTWYGPPQPNQPSSSGLGRGLAALGMGAIQEEEDEEDDLDLDLNDINTEDFDAAASKNPSRTSKTSRTVEDSLCYSSSANGYASSNGIV